MAVATLNIRLSTAGHRQTLSQELPSLQTRNQQQSSPDFADAGYNYKDGKQADQELAAI